MRELIAPNHGEKHFTDEGRSQKPLPKPKKDIRSHTLHVEDIKKNISY